MSKLKQFGILSFLAFCIVVGCFAFCRGFLLNRQVLTQKSSPCRNNSSSVFYNRKSSTSWCNQNPLFSSAIFVLIDALRYDFVHRMPFISGLLKRQEQQIDDAGLNVSTCAFKFVADPPTTTMQRLKAIMSGTMPTFIDASANFNSYEVLEDNIIFQLHAAGKRIAFSGDDTWLSLFPRSLFNSSYVEPLPSFNAWDLDTVDRAVNASIMRLLQPDLVTDWDVLITHILGVDHCGHRYGPLHPEMKRKLEEADQTVEFIFNKMSDDTLLIVFGDHGMTKTGDHGGDSANEVEAGLLFLSKGSKINEVPFQCNSNFRRPQTVSQIDLVPTVATLLGFPIPFSSIGQVIPKFLRDDLYTNAIIANVAQVSQYVESYETISTPELKQLKEEVDDAFQEFSLDDKNSSKRRILLRTAEKYIQNVRNFAISSWTKFDMVSIHWGIGITFLGITSVILYSNLRSFSWIIFMISTCGTSSVLLNFIFGSTFGLFGIKAMTTFGLCFFIIITICLPSTPNNESPSSTLKQKQYLDGLPPNSLTTSDIVAIIFYALSCLGVFANSFVINEGYVLGSIVFAVATFQVLLQQCKEQKELQYAQRTKTLGFLASKKIFIWRNGVRGSWFSLLPFAIMLRIGALFFRCREELTECREDFILHKHATSLPEEWVVYKCIRFGLALLSLAVFVVTFREWMMMRKCISSSKRPSAVLGKYMPSVLIVLTGAHWALEGLPFSNSHLLMIQPFLNHFPLVYQTLTVLAQVVIWFDPLCCFGTTRNSNYHYIDEDVSKSMISSDKKSKAKKNGILLHSHYLSTTGENNHETTATDAPISSEASTEDVFSSSILINCVFTVLLLVQITVTGITPAVVVIIPFVITSIIGLYSVSSHQNSWSLCIIWTLASQFFFYGTGHQAVFAAIPWDSAFIASTDSLGSSQSNSWIDWIRPGLAVVGNLYASQIIFSMALPLVIYWKGVTMTESIIGKNERSELYSFGGKFIVLHAVKMFVSMIAAAYHRRHLMVWKIFAPKLIFEIFSFLVILIMTTLSLLFVTRIDYHFQQALEKERKELRQLFRTRT